jgi:signal transduction histidine kinase
MTDAPNPKSDYEASIRTWERKVPLYRRISARTGLQGKLVLSFMFLLTVSLGSSCWLFLTESRVVLDRVMSEQARAISHTLAMASETPLDRGDLGELDRIGRDLLKNRDLVAVAFHRASGELMSVACQDPRLTAAARTFLPDPRAEVANASEAQRRWTPALGGYVQSTAPVTAHHPTAAGAARQPGGRVVGYVTVCVSQAKDEQQIERVGQLLILIGAVAALVSLPLVYGLVHRIFHPIRQLVSATHAIAGGNLGTQVAIHRPDVIGTLARSFNEMVKRVRSQQEELEATNEKLADANARLERANASLEAANRDLEEKVGQRTAQLEAANRRLSSEIAEKEDFLRAVSHDLNAPLRNISGMATMLLMKYRQTFDEDVVHRLERIQKNVQVETDLIAELLELSRIKTRRQKHEPVDLGAMVTELGGLFEDDLRRTGIRLLIDGTLPVLTCERARLRQVFQNLIDNAIKYMGDGSAPAAGATPLKEIRVGCRLRGDEAEFYVRDTGIGIEPDDLDKVFFVFRRGKSPAVQGVAGKGVGLASVKSIVETYNGTIWVESAPGAGSTFRFTINGKYVGTSGPLPHGRAA